MSKQNQKGKGKSKNTEPSRAGQAARTANNKIKKAEKTLKYKIAHAVAMKRKEKQTTILDTTLKPSGYRIWLIQKERARKEEEKNKAHTLPLLAQEPRMFTLQARAKLV